ncbi:MAG: protein-L-isoaspartate O-methyltransferase, partial [Alphaproteobacteria bacterium HGW-Alphaproteobacteria-8]
QVRPSDVTRFAIIAAMLDVPRETFTPRAHRAVAYADAQIPLGQGRVLLDPRTFAKMLEAAEILPSELVLDVGVGYGYSAVVLARIAAAVMALEEDATLAAHAAELIPSADAHTVILETGPLAAGAPASGPYDVILLEGGVEIVPEPLLAQLKDGGRLVAIVMDGPLGQATVFTRAGDVVSSRRAFDATAPVLPGFDTVRSFAF